MIKIRKTQSVKSGVVTIQQLAEHVGLTKGTISAALNDTAAAKAIPQHTKDRIFAAARDLNYHPNFFASTLKRKRTFAIGVIAEEIGDAYGGLVISGIESFLSRHKYLFMTVAHRHDPQLLQRYLSILLVRGIEGLITVDTILEDASPIPTVAIAGHRRLKGVTNVTLDHDRAAQLALNHLSELGHREIAFFRGQSYSADSSARWRSICDVAAKLKIRIRPELVSRLDTDDASPKTGYRLTKELLSREPGFTAIFAYNDISAIGAMSAIRAAGLRVPEDVSVVGFDDIRDAAYHNPSLTTVRQPLREMGEIAARALLDRIEGGKESGGQISVEPELVVRESTSKVARRPAG